MQTRMGLDKAKEPRPTGSGQPATPRVTERDGDPRAAHGLHLSTRSEGAAQHTDIWDPESRGL